MQMQGTQLIRYILSDNFGAAKNAVRVAKTCNYAIPNLGTPLQACIDANSKQMCDLLVKSEKASLMYAPAGMDLPLVYAICRGKYVIAHHLLTLGADPRVRSTSGETSAMLCCRSKDTIPLLNAIITPCPEALLDLNAERESCLLVAASYKMVDLCRYLCHSKGVTSMLYKTPTLKGINALMYACYLGDVNCYRTLSQLIPFHSEDYAGWCSLSYCILGKQSRFLDDIIRDASVYSDPHFQHCMGNCLVTAISNNDMDAARSVLTRVVNVVLWKNSVCQSTVMHALAAFGTKSMANLLMPHLNLQCDEPLDCQNNTPLMVTLYHMNDFMTTLMLDNFRVNLNNKNIYGYSPIDLAVMLR